MEAPNGMESPGRGTKKDHIAHFSLRIKPTQPVTNNRMDINIIYTKRAPRESGPRRSGPFCGSARSRPSLRVETFSANQGGSCLLGPRGSQVFVSLERGAE